MANLYGGAEDHGGDFNNQAVIKMESPIPIAIDTPSTKSTIEQADSPIPQSATSIPSTPSQINVKKSMRVLNRLSRLEASHLPTTSRLKFVVHDPAGKSQRGERVTAAPKGLNIKSPTVIRAEQVQAGLEPKFPSFIKSMVKSHVASGFWMGFPVSFCKSFLPKIDTTVILEDENRELFQLKYIAYKTGLSGGWGNFAIEHKLLVGDVLIFQLVECYKFKVYIIRANDSKEIDGAFGLLDLESQTKRSNAAVEVAATTPNQKKRKRQKSLTLNAIQKKKRSSLTKSVPQHAQPPLELPELIENSDMSSSNIPRIENINSFTDFSIVVNGLCIDSELPEDVRVQYYELCCSKKAFLHTHLPQGLYFKLVAGMIGETVGIAYSLKACKPTTSLDDFAIWDKSLESFELLGMRVGFLRERLHRLQRLAVESEGALDMKRYVNAKSEQSRNADEIRRFEAKLTELKEASGKFDAVIHCLKEKVERHEAEFQELVDAPW